MLLQIAAVITLVSGTPVSIPVRNPGLTPASPEGPLALPGTYTVRLTVGQATISQTVTVRNDPRSPASPSARVEQHLLQLQITTAMRATWDAEHQVIALRSALTRATAGHANAEVVAAAAALRATIDSTAGAGTGRSAGGRAPARPTFRGINASMAGQLTAQDNADFAPTPAMRAAYTSVCRDLSVLHAAWQRVLQRDLPAANVILARHGVPALAAPRAGVSPRC